MIDRIRNRTTAALEVSPVISSIETPTSAMNFVVGTQNAPNTSETSKCALDPSLTAAFDDILKIVKNNNDRLVSIEPKISKISDLATVISSQTSGIDEGFIRFNDHLSNLFEVIKSQSINSNIHLDSILTENIDKLQVLKRNATNHRSKLKESTTKSPDINLN